MQEFVNKHFYYLFLFTLFFGLLTYGLIGFQSIDEICGVILFIMFLFYMFRTKEWVINKAFLYVIIIFIFYLCYSFYIGSNRPKAIITDFIIQLKPYLAFFCVYQLKPSFDKKQKKILQQLCLICWAILLPIGFGGAINNQIFNVTMAHSSNYASAVTAVALLYYYTSHNTKNDRLIFVCMLALGLLSSRAKFYGFFVVAIFVALYFSDMKNLKFNLKNMVILFFMFVVILFVAKDKIELYFLQGISVNAEKDFVARFALYATSGMIFVDYLPFGSGFASFATHASGIYYSPIYSEYELDGIWGLSRSYGSFISDTYYPSLAQFGMVGAILFICFWIHLLRKAFFYFKKTDNTHLLILTMIVVAYFTIENVADATFTSNRGFFFMMFLGLIFSEMKNGIKIKMINRDHVSEG